ncbi:uncharacterized protein LOC132929073 [Rhopalosiphum padi]|uniref:uncharacterized protein LOC132929073 n=1 Tax=Rhopalosiphum padi TaxID=40932 RepID=UPI00298D77CA|nr:uncharacterized protein LOC132929073 [Rhopalosiphum padi]
MDGENDTSELFVNVLENVGTLIQEFVDRKIEFNTTNRFNTGCSKEVQCENVALFCNLTTLLCQCAEFHFWNDTIGICQFKRKNMIDWYTNKYGFTPKDEMFYLLKLEPEHAPSRYDVALPVLIIMIIGCLCFLSCIIYICNGKNEVDEDKTVSAALFKQHAQTNRLQTSIVRNI